MCLLYAFGGYALHDILCFCMSLVVMHVMLLCVCVFLYEFGGYARHDTVRVCVLV